MLLEFFFQKTVVVKAERAFPGFGKHHISFNQDSEDPVFKEKNILIK